VSSLSAAVQGSGCRAVNESKKQTTTIQQGKGCKKNIVSGPHGQ